MVFPNLHNLSDPELVKLCQQSSRQAWEEFFRRFIPLLKSCIRQSLKSFAEPRKIELDDMDEVWDIHSDVVKTIYGKMGICRCVRPEGVEAWLRTVATNATITWLRRHGRLKNLPRNYHEGQTFSLDEPIGEDETSTYHDLIAAPSNPPDKADRVSALIADALAQQINLKNRMVMRLSLLSLLPLRPNECDELVGISPLDIVKARKLLDEMVAEVAERDKRRRKETEHAVLLWYELISLEKKVQDPSVQSSPEYPAVLEKYERKRKQRDELMASSSKLPMPSNQQIAAFLGIETPNDVSNYRKRAQQKICKDVFPLLQGD